MSARFITAIGAGLGNTIRGVGFFTRFFGAVLARSGIVLQRPRLVSQQVHFIGNYSLLIIAVSGMFVGFVLGLQGYYTLNRYGSEEALGLLVALSLVRELGPVVTALLFAGRAGTSLTAEIGLMKVANSSPPWRSWRSIPCAGCWCPASGAASSPCPSWPRSSPWSASWAAGSSGWS